MPEARIKDDVRSCRHAKVVPVDWHRIGAAGEIADLGQEGDGGDQRHAAQGLKGLGQRRHRPARDQGFDLGGQAITPGLGVLDGLDSVLQDDLLGRLLEPQRRQPAAVCQGPVLASSHAPVARAENPLSCWRARRRVLTRSPGRPGISEGATTAQSYPSPLN